MGETPEKSEPKIYAACLAAYNNGYLHGAWINANQDAMAIYAEIAAMLKASPIADAEEAAIHDHEGFEGVEIGEFTGIDRVSALAGFIAEHGTLGAELVNHFGGDLDEAREALEDRYHGQFESLADYAEQATFSAIHIPKAVRYYIDWEAMARDWEMNGDMFAIHVGRHEAHVFSGR